MNRILTLLTILTATLIAGFGSYAQRPRLTHSHPDMAKIKEASTDPTSQFYFPRLMDKFFENDTSMTAEQYRYFYYGAIFQEDYDPYRPSPFENEVKQLGPIYLKRDHLSKGECKRIISVAEKVLGDNPLDLRQLNYMVYAYKSLGKVNIANIWASKLNNLLLTIASSGTGNDPENAWVVTYQTHEYDFFNLSGSQVTVTGSEFVEPYYEKVTIKVGKKDPKESDHYFNLHHMLEQYYLKHPEELERQ